MLTVPELCRALAPHGTGVMVIDPHEYANVLGMDGIRYVLESSKNLPIDFFIMLPSCVPATHLETAGARFTANDLALLIADDRIAGRLQDRIRHLVDADLARRLEGDRPHAGTLWTPTRRRADLLIGI